VESPNLVFLELSAARRQRSLQSEGAFADRKRVSIPSMKRVIQESPMSEAGVYRTQLSQS